MPRYRHPAGQELPEPPAPDDDEEPDPPSPPRPSAGRWLGWGR